MQADSLRLELKGMMSSYIVASDCRRVAGRHTLMVIHTSTGNLGSVL